MLFVSHLAGRKLCALLKKRGSFSHHLYFFCHSGIVPVTLRAAKSLCPNHFTFEKAQSINFPFCFAERYFYNLPPNSLFPPQEEKLERKLCVLSKVRSFARTAQDDHPAVTLSAAKSLCLNHFTFVKYRQNYSQ